jgi:hypothetical protein
MLQPHVADRHHVYAHPAEGVGDPGGARVENVLELVVDEEQATFVRADHHGGRSLKLETAKSKRPSGWIAPKASFATEVRTF